MSLRVFWDSIYELCQESVHREGVDPNSMEGVRDLNHIGVVCFPSWCKVQIIVVPKNYSHSIQLLKSVLFSGDLPLED